MDGGNSITAEPKKYKGVRQRKWGKWVSEIRVLGSQERLWLGSYSTAEAAAVAHDVASYCLRGEKSCLDGKLNFPLMLPSSLGENMSPRSIQKAASDAGMAIDAQMILNSPISFPRNDETMEDDYIGLNWGAIQCSDGGDDKGLSISVEDYL